MDLLDSIRSKKPVDRLLYWIEEREAIRIRKESGQAYPWTKDPILRKFRFCNVRRMDDRVSKWLYKNWYEPNFDHPNMPIAVVMARFFNWEPTLEFIGFPHTYCPSTYVERLKILKHKSKTMFNSAYMVRAEEKGREKYLIVIERYLGSFIEKMNKVKNWIDRTSMEKTIKHIQTAHGFGSFMAGQITADLRWAIEGSWKDKNSYAPLGPGSQRGYNRLYELELKEPVEEQLFLQGLYTIRDIVTKTLPKVAARLELHDYQNCLCEFDKYERVLWGSVGRLRMYTR